MRIYKQKDLEISKCKECPCFEEKSDTLGTEAYTYNCKTNHLEYICSYGNEKSLGTLDWKDGKWVGDAFNFKESIPEWCPLPKKYT